jgi:hypothetical protein
MAKSWIGWSTSATSSTGDDVGPGVNGLRLLDPATGQMVARERQRREGDGEMDAGGRHSGGREEAPIWGPLHDVYAAGVEPRAGWALIGVNGHEPREVAEYAGEGKPSPGVDITQCGSDVTPA